MAEAVSTPAAPAAPAAPASTSASMAATPTAPSAPAVGTVAPTTENVNPGAWMAGFNDDLKGYVGNKGFKDPSALADAYRSLEKLQGVPQERLAKLPESFYDDKGALTPDGRAIYERLGTPKTAAEYGIEIPKEGGEAIQNFTKIAHDLGLTKTQVQGLYKAEMDAAKVAGQTRADIAAAAFRDQDAAIRKEWGAAFEDNKRSAAEAKRKLGLTDTQIDGLSGQIGHAETLKLLANIGKSVGEATFFNGKQPDRALEPANAKARIGELMRDRDFTARLERNDTEARGTWDRLHQQAYRGTINI